MRSDDAGRDHAVVEEVPARVYPHSRFKLRVEGSRFGGRARVVLPASIYFAGSDDARRKLRGSQQPVEMSVERDTFIINITVARPTL